MKKTEFFKIFRNKYVDFSLFLLAGFFMGWLVFRTSGKTAETHDHAAEVATRTIWTCAMHPQIRMNEAGKCPICGMELIPLARNGNSSADPDAIHLSKEAAQLANVMTSTVSKQKPVKEVRLYGKVEADERLIQSLVAHVPGRLDKLYINFTGESVKSGQLLAQIYSPDLISAQQELLEAAKTKLSQPSVYEAAIEKLRQFKLTDDQIENLERSGRVESTIDVVSNSSGIVTSKLVNTGDYVSQGTTLFRIADLSSVWILFEAYESDLQYINKNERVTFTLQAFPGTEFTGNIVFIDPVIDPFTRVAKVRIEVENKTGKIKPGMFANGIINAVLTGYGDNPVIPKTAVLWTGKRSVVYVKEPGSEDPVFKMREIDLGPMLGDSYLVTGGLNEGEEIVTMGTFNVDAAAQLDGKPSMMHPSSGTRSGTRDENRERNEVSLEFKMQLNVVYDKYILLKNALILAILTNQSRQLRVFKLHYRIWILNY